MNIYLIISIALNRLHTLDSEAYPNLYYFRDKTYVVKHLEALLQLLQSKDKPVVTIASKAYFLFSQRFIRLWSKEEKDCNGNTERWQSHLIFLKDLGLLETYMVTGPSENQVLNRIWEKAKNNKQKCETLWTVPLYDDERLIQAEHIAAIYREYQVNVAHLRKNILIRFRGQKRANWLYSNKRRIGKIEATLLSYCRKSITQAIKDKGYTTFKEMEKRVHALCTGRQYYQQILAELLNPKESDRQDLFQSTMNLILQEKALLCYEVNCEHRQIRNTDRERLNIPKNVNSWIIVPKKG